MTTSVARTGVAGWSPDAMNKLLNLEWKPVELDGKNVRWYNGWVFYKRFSYVSYYHVMIVNHVAYDLFEMHNLNLHFPILITITTWCHPPVGYMKSSIWYMSKERYLIPHINTIHTDILTIVCNTTLSLDPSWYHLGFVSWFNTLYLDRLRIFSFSSVWCLEGNMDFHTIFFSIHTFITWSYSWSITISWDT